MHVHQSTMSCVPQSRLFGGFRSLSLLHIVRFFFILRFSRRQGQSGPKGGPETLVSTTLSLIEQVRPIYGLSALRDDFHT